MTSPALARPSWTLSRALIVLWAVGGVVALLLQAIVRLTPHALDALAAPLTPLQALLYAAWVAIAAYSEGYRAFQLRFSPKVIARALYLSQNPSPLGVLLAPAFCMALFFAKRRALIVAWCTLLMILCLIALLRITPQPWRGIVDGGVVVGLGWGTLSLLWHGLRVLGGHPPQNVAELP
jgi:hypothetical protein